MSKARCVVILWVCSGVALAGDAVSGVNGKIGYLGGIGVYGAEYNQKGHEYAQSQGTQYTGAYGLIATRIWPHYDGSGTLAVSEPGGAVLSTR